MPPRRNVGGLVFDERSGRYRAPSGKFVSRVAVRAAIDAALKNAETRALSLGEQLRTRKITRVTWEREMQRIVKEVHVYSATAAKGGFDQLTQADYGRVGQAVRRQYQFLEKFSADIKRGLPLDGRMASRSALYAQSGRSTFHTTERREMERRGLDEERSVLHPADHCEGDGSCTEEAAKGWQPLGSMLPIGSRLCRGRCKCSVQYRRSAA